ncbi:MAG: hypothetical protein ACQERG_04605 [Pseudomonadota bacterium]
MSLEERIAALETELDQAGLGGLGRHLEALEEKRALFHPEALAYLERARGEWGMGQVEQVRSSLREVVDAYRRLHFGCP